MANQRPLSERLSKLPPGRHLIPSDFVAQSQRERMLLATAELVAERGYQKTTIELIAKTSRVALVTFYEHFSSKEDCFLAAFDESVAAAKEVFSELLDSEQPWPDQISSGLEIFLEMVIKEQALPDGLEVAIAGGIVWLVHQRLVADDVDDLMALLPEMLQVTLTPFIGEVEAGRAADAAQARVAA
jgi:AcrR family transcriptional regulator